MSIDNCQHSFKELAKTVLPQHMRRMRQAMASSLDMSLLCKEGVGPKSILKRLERTEDFAGCYVLMEGAKPIYVGISRSVIKRLVQHVKGRTHFDASLAYRIASDKYAHNMNREAAMSDLKFKKEFERARNYIFSLKAAFINIESDFELYLFEAYCALELKTSKWNTFRTH